MCAPPGNLKFTTSETVSPTIMGFIRMTYIVCMEVYLPFSTPTNANNDYGLDYM